MQIHYLHFLKKRRFWIIVILLISLFTYLAIDLFAPLYYTPRFGNVRTRILIIDVNGDIEPIRRDGEVIYIRGLEVNDFRVLGSLDADVIVIVAHGLTIRDQSRVADLGGYAIETSEENTLANILAHPVLLLTGSIVKANVNGSQRIALTKNILRYSKPFTNKIIILLTCGSEYTREFAVEFIRHGASMVAYTNNTISLDFVNTILKSIIDANDTDEIKEIIKTSELLVISIENRPHTSDLKMVS